MTERSIKIRYNIISGDFLKGGEASSSVKKALMQLGINSYQIKRVCVVCYEAEMNVVIHTLGGFMEVTVFKDRVEVEVQDLGPGIENIELAMREGYSTAPDKAREMGFGGGMGLPNMKRSSDEFDIKSQLDQGTTVKMKIYY